MNLKTLNDTPPWEWPENAGEIILEVLCNKNASAADRILAADLAGDGTIIDDNIASHLLTVIGDSNEPEELRFRAAIALGPALEYADMMEFDELEDTMLSEKGFREVQERLREIYDDTDNPQKVRRGVLEASVRASMDWHKEAIQTAYSSNDEKWLLTAIFCMGHVKGFEDQILESLKSKNPDVYYEAVCAAGNWGIKEAWPYIEEIFTRDDVDKPLLVAAIDAAASMGTPETADILFELSESDDEEIAEAADDALAMAGLLVDGLSEDDLADDDLLEDDLSEDDPSKDDLF